MNRMPLTKNQFGIYIECISRPDYTTYNLPFIQKLDDEIDIERFLKILRKLIELHPALSARIVTDENGTVCLEEGPLTEPSVIESDDPDLFAHADDLVRPFEIEGGTLSRFEIYKTPSGNYYFRDTHHIISDGASLHIMASELDILWKGENPDPEGVSVFELAEEETRARTKETLEEQKRFYETLLDGAETDCSPFADSEETESSMGWLELSFEMDTDSFKARRKEAGVSTGNFFTTVYGVLTAKFSAIHSSVITHVYHGRTREEMRNTVNLMVKTLPFVTDISKDTDINALLARAQETVTESRKRTDYSFSEIAEEIGAGMEMSFGYMGRIFSLNPVPFSSGESKRIYDPAHIESSKILMTIGESDGGAFGSIWVTEKTTTRTRSRSVSRKHTFALQRNSSYVTGSRKYSLPVRKRLSFWMNSIRLSSNMTGNTR